MSREAATYCVPPTSKVWVKWFAQYSAFYLRKHFHSFSLLRTGMPKELIHWPLLVCLNHPSWWDPLTAFHLSQRFFPDRQHYAPIAQEGLGKYKFFAKLGCFGLDMHTYAGAATFLKIGHAVLQSEKRALWVTAQGSFRDVRERPCVFEPGVGHLARRLERCAMLPVALEYSFWNERSPEAFACLGTPVFIEDGRRKTADQWTETFAAALEATQNILAAKVQRRDSSAFEPLLHGQAGVGGVYDLWRRVNARMRGRKFQPEHGGT